MKAQTCNYEVNVSLIMSWHDALGIIDSINNLHLVGIRPPETLEILKEELKRGLKNFHKDFGWKTE